MNLKSISKILFITLFCAFALSINNVNAQYVKVINNKGTFFQIDTSKWTLVGVDIYNKNTNGNVGIGIFPTGARFVISNNSAILPAFKLKYPFTGSSSDSILTWNPVDSTVRKITLLNLLTNHALISLNGLTVSTQTFTTGSSGTDFNISSSGSIHTFNIPTSSASNRGMLSNTDWVTFNSKISSISATTAAAITVTGTTVIINNTLAYWNANQLQGRTVSSTAPTNGQVLTWNNTSSQWEPSNTAFQSTVVEIYDAAGTQALTATFGNLTFGTTNISDAGYTVGGSGSQITITTAGTYKITCKITAHVTNNTSTGGEFQLTRNGTVISGTLGYTYHHNSDRDEGSVTIVKIITLNSNDIIRVQGRRYSISGNITLSSNGSSLIIERIK
jgi:hypothetical protein